MATFKSDRQQVATETLTEKVNNAFAGKTPQELEELIDSSVIDLDSAKTALKKMVRLLANHERRIRKLENKS